jgi:hypothetical protein
MEGWRRHWYLSISSLAETATRENDSEWQVVFNRPTERLHSDKLTVPDGHHPHMLSLLHIRLLCPQLIPDLASTVLSA